MEDIVICSPDIIAFCDEEEWTIMESLSSDVKITDLLNELNLKTHEEQNHTVTRMRIKLRS